MLQCCTSPDDRARSTGWAYDAPLEVVYMPRQHMLWLTEAFVERKMREDFARGFIGV